MKPNFEEMSKVELKAYVQAHREDDEAIRVLFGRRNPSDLEATIYPSMFTEDGKPLFDNIRMMEDAIAQQIQHLIGQQ